MSNNYSDENSNENSSENSDEISNYSENSQLSNNSELTENDKIDKPGCEHYITRCKIICPKCDKDYYCRFCHDDIENSFNLPLNQQHQIDRHSIKEIICDECKTKQYISNECINCKIKFAEYFCDKCNLYDDNGLTKQIYHCDKCNICRIGNGQQYYHCDGCATCINILMKDTHKCADVTDEVCPICNELFFTTRHTLIKLNCGHWIHKNCFVEMLNHNNFTCPFCSKLMVDLTQYYNIIDGHIKETPMPEEYANKHVNILCNECLKTNNVLFPFYGLKCPDCESYNTKQIT